MINKNYKMPFNVGSLIKEDGNFEMCDIAESIAQNVMLLITTKKGENRYDPEYGNEVWDLEFENGVTIVEWEKIFTKSLKQEIAQYEPRIINPKISVHIEFVEQTYHTKKISEMKKRARVAINAILTDSGERFSFSTELFLSPMSID